MKTEAELTELFRARGLRVTPQRQAIFRRLFGDEGHPTVETLYDSVRSEMPTISLKTVYQTVHDLDALGQVTLLDVGTGSVRVDPNVEAAHQHLVCRECGLVRDVPLEVSVRLPNRFRRDFALDSVDVIFRGLCDDCSDQPR